MSKIINYLLAYLPIVKKLNGSKRYIGFVIWLLGYLAQGVGVAAQAFPEYQGLQPVAQQMGAISLQLAEVMKQLGIDIVLIGVGHAALKEKLVKE